MPIAWAELPAPVQQLVYDGLGVMGVLALNREWRACRERRVAERLPCDTHNVPSSLPGGIVLRLLPNYAIEPEVGLALEYPRSHLKMMHSYSVPVIAAQQALLLHLPFRELGAYTPAS